MKIEGKVLQNSSFEELRYGMWDILLLDKTKMTKSRFVQAVNLTSVHGVKFDNIGKYLYVFDFKHSWHTQGLLRVAWLNIALQLYDLLVIYLSV